MSSLSDLLTVHSRRPLAAQVSLGGTPPADRQAGQDSYAAWVSDPTQENLSAVLDGLSPVINSEIQRFTGPKPLLRSKAKALAIKAIRSYDPSSGAKLNSWVVTQLQPLARYNNSLKPIYVPEEASRKAYALSKAEAEFMDSHGRAPTDAELADEVGVSVKRLKRLRTMTPATVNTPDSEDLGSDDVSQEHVVYTSNPVQAAQDAVYNGLDKRDRMIFDWRTGLHGKTALSNKDIAVRLGVSPAFVSQRSDRIARMIRDTSQYGGL